MLVVDDEPAVARAIQRRLRGHEVEVMTEPEAVIACVDAAEQDGRPFEVVISDYRMPKLSGIALFERLREKSEPPVMILMSGYELGDTPAADAVVSKPCGAEEILEVIEVAKAARSRMVTRRFRRILRPDA